MSNPDDDWLRGARLFDEGAFFAAHEAWEARWLVETDPEARRVLQGLIQIAAGFYKVFPAAAPVPSRAASASRLFARGLAKLDASPILMADGALAAFADGVRDWALALTQGTIDRASVPRLGLERPPARPR